MTDNDRIIWTAGSGGAVILTMDSPTRSANTLDEQFLIALTANLDRVEAEREAISGLVLTSAKSTFFAGGDLNEIFGADRSEAARLSDYITRIKAQLRRLETIGVPVVAAINGAALGGGYEIALSCHRRIATRSAVVGLPEVTLGLLPGGGGVSRSVRLFGIHRALDELLLRGEQYRAGQALERGLVDEVVATPADLVPAALAWIETQPAAVQPWDAPGYKIPGGRPQDKQVELTLAPATALLQKSLKGAEYPAPRAILAAAVEGAMVDFETAQRIETRYFVEVAVSPIAKNMIKGRFLDLQTINSGARRPAGVDTFTSRRAGVLGAGMMGAAIAYCLARGGAEVVLKDVSLEVAERGKEYSRKLLDGEVARGRFSDAQAQEILDRIRPSDSPEAFKGVDTVIEAVLEDVAVKQQVFQEIDAHIDPEALLATNTSSLPITELAHGISRPTDFIGMHFFSPVDKMQLVEIVVGEKTGDIALARAFDVARQMGKTPIVVNDSRGFYTSRAIESFLNEAIAMVGEGCHPLSVERAASQAGYPAPPLQLMDNLTLTLLRSVRKQTRAAQQATGKPYLENPAEPVMDVIIDELGRQGRAAGGGFYDYADGRRQCIYPGLLERFTHTEVRLPMADMKERMLFAEALETVKCFDEGVLTSAEDANIGSLLGIGYPAWTGGTVQYMENYVGGLSGFVARARELESAYGQRFRPPASLVAAAESGNSYPA